MNTFEFLMWGAICVLVILPPKYDPAIRWKERNERRLGRWKGPEA